MQTIAEDQAQAPFRPDDAGAARLDLDPLTEMQKLNAAFAAMRAQSASDPARLCIDMSRVDFILVECLMTLVAEISRRQERGLGTTLRLPQSERVRAFLREWDFPIVVKQITGITFYDLVDPRDHHFFRGRGGDGGVDGERSFKIYKSYHWRDQEWKVPLDMNRFFAFRTWDVADFLQADDPLRFKRAVLDESERWANDTVIEAVLRNALGPYYKYLPSHIVHEAMSNAFRHGGARSIAAVSKADFGRNIGRSRFLTLSFWDDGVPMHGTLKAALHLNKPIVSGIHGVTPQIEYDVRQGTERLKRSSAVIPGAEGNNEDFLLAALFPGVTSDPDGIGHFPHPEMSDPVGSLPGSGLSNLVNAAVDIFGGSVAIRSGAYFMNVKRSKKTSPDATAPKYGVKIEDHGPFKGNMVTVRLPLAGLATPADPA